jgi:hypothetical protein
MYEIISLSREIIKIFMECLLFELILTSFQFS